MLTTDRLRIDEHALARNIEHTLDALGNGDMNTVAYDTAWIARLAPYFPGKGFDGALEWIREHQHPDGSWGADLVHYHDRTICTLAAIMALRLTGRDVGDEKRIREGENFLWREAGKLHIDANDTIAFPVLMVSLVNEAMSVGLDVPRDMYHDLTVIEKKLNLLSESDPRKWRYTTMSFSLEAVSSSLVRRADELFLADNGSASVSPAATAAVLIYSRQTTDNALNYLQRTVARQPDGGAPQLAPFDIFETVWALHHLRQTGAITPDQPRVRQLLDFLWESWSPQTGLTFSRYFSVPDLDDTAVGYSLLEWGGYEVSPDVFCVYEEARHFRCYPDESDPSLSVNIRTLQALRGAEHKNARAWRDKIVAMLRLRSADGIFWHDKWHISPYYLMSPAVQSLQGLADDLAQPRVRWITKTQRPDGGWGFYGQSTAEETAYCLEALLSWEQAGGTVDSSQLEAAAIYLNDHIDSVDAPSLWIGKCLYTPHYIVRSAVQAALYGYLKRGG